MQKIVIIGGAHQGKAVWAAKQFPQYQRIVAAQLWNCLQEKEFPPHMRIDSFHNMIRQWLQEGKNVDAISQSFCRSTSWLIIADEIGSGIVPMEAQDRLWREKTGRILCDLVSQADTVYRVFCGIPQQLKGEKTEGVFLC